MATPAKVRAQLGIPADYARTRNLTLHREATRLVYVGRNPDGRRLRLTPDAARAWRRMRAAAEGDGIELIAISAFRSVRRQTALIRKKLAAGKAIEDILRYMAAPGFSEHHTGRALDIGSPGHTELEEAFAGTAAFRWLSRHARKFGFRLSYPRHNRNGIGYEPWHWCWRR